MKKILFIALVACIAQAQAATSVLMENSTHVGFAPPQYQGVYKVQILSDGTIQKVDNKQKITKFAKLSAAATKSLAQQIANLEITDLQGNEDGPMCSDAPMRKTTVMKNSQEVEIKTNISCRIKEMTSAYSLNSIMDSADTLTSALSR